MSNSQAISDAFRAALLRIATEGDALSAQECQEIAAEALGISVPEPPHLEPPPPPKELTVGFKLPAYEPSQALPSHIRDKIEGVYYGSAKALE